MKKRLISLILAAIVLLSCAFAEESQSEEYLLPYIDLYAVPLGENAIFEMSNDWAYQVLAQVGSYGQIFERNLGTRSPLGLDRGLNRSWKNGGLFMPPQLR